MIGQSADDLGANADSIVNSCTSFLFLKDATFNRKRYAELFKMNEQQLALFESLQDREGLYMRRDGLTKVVTLNLDSRSYATFSTKPKDRVRRTKLIEKYGLSEGISRFAPGRDRLTKPLPTERTSPVKPPIFVFVTFGLALATASASASTTPEPHHLQPNAPRSVTVTEAETPPVIRARPDAIDAHSCFPARREDRHRLRAGDTVDWVFDGGHVASRFISIKPKLANTTTDIHIVSDHGNEYTLQLQEISGEADSHFDSKVFIVPRRLRPRRTGLPICQSSCPQQNWIRPSRKP